MRIRFHRPPPPPMVSPGFDVEKELEAVVGRYEESPGERAWRRYGRIAARALAAACLAIAAVAAIVFVLHTHVMQAQVAPAPKKPVMIDIKPAPK